MTDVAAGAWRIPKDGYRRDMVLPEDLWQRKRIRFAVTAIQRELIVLGLLDADPNKLDGGFGVKTDAAVKKYQTVQRLLADGWVGRKTARTLWHPLYVADQMDLGIPDMLLWGQGGLESGYDPGAEGPNPLGFAYFDRGIEQINRNAHPEIGDAQAFGDVAFSIRWSGLNMHNAYLKYGTWDAAILYHNSPEAAGKLARGERIDPKYIEYIRLVRASAAQPL